MSVPIIRLAARVVLAGAAVVACGDGVAEPPVVAAISVTPDVDTLTALDQTVQLTASARDASGRTLRGAFSWSTGNASIASVSTGGLVTAVANGTVEIRASMQGVTGVATLTVLQRAAQLVFRSEPPATVEGQLPFGPVEVRVEDAAGHLVPHAGAAVSVALATSPSGEPLAGTTTAVPVNGIVTFNDLALALPGDGFVLAASSGALAPASSAPFRVGLTFARVSAGSGHTCGVTVAAFAYCWGDNEDGQLGNGTSSEPGSFTPSPVAGGLRFAQIEAGSAHTCGVTTDHVGYCWGFNNQGQVGDGTSGGDRVSPTPIAGGLAFRLVVAGSNHSCGVTTADAAWCWGLNSVGQLGDGTTTASEVPVQVTGGLSFAGLARTGVCGFTTGGDGYCWGGTTSVPVQVGAGTSFDLLDGSGVHRCGVAPDAAGWCWGLNTFGQLGDGTTTNRGSPTAVAGGLSWALIRPAGVFTCGVTTGAVAYCWGDNSAGALGDGTTTQRTAPTPVGGGLSVVEVSTGPAHACGVTVSGGLYCWGDNDSGQLGDGTTTGHLLPVRVIQ